MPDLEAAVRRWIAARKQRDAAMDDEPGDHSVVTPAEERELDIAVDEAERDMYALVGEEYEWIWGELMSDDEIAEWEARDA